MCISKTKILSGGWMICAYMQLWVSSELANVYTASLFPQKCSLISQMYLYPVGFRQADPVNDVKQCELMVFVSVPREERMLSVLLLRAQ